MDKYVLMLEDDKDDRFLTEQSLKESGISVPIRYLSNSHDMIPFLSQNERPLIIVIDYNATPDNGPAVLRKLKADDQYKDIPVIILSDSNFPEYARECYASGACSYIQKPSKYEETQRKVQTFFRYWLEVAEV